MENIVVFSENQIGAASIDQVHEAALKSGTKVRLKVEYPEVSDWT